MMTMIDIRVGNHVLRGCLSFVHHMILIFIHKSDTFHKNTRNVAHKLESSTVPSDT